MLSQRVEIRGEGEGGEMEGRGDGERGMKTKMKWKGCGKLLLDKFLYIT